jgi:ferritin-like metal-binding protein YciE
MKFFSENIQDLKQLYITKLKSAYGSEKQITEALPKMQEAATDPQLKQAFQSHLQETEIHVERLNQMLTDLTGEAEGSKCKVTAALIEVGDSIAKDVKDDSVRDVALIGAAQAVEHFEMANYGTLRLWAKLLGFPQHAEMLNQTLQEEGHADKLLTTIADRETPVATRAA